MFWVYYGIRYTPMISYDWDVKWSPTGWLMGSHFHLQLQHRRPPSWLAKSAGSALLRADAAPGENVKKPRENFGKHRENGWDQRKIECGKVPVGVPLTQSGENGDLKLSVKWDLKIKLDISMRWMTTRLWILGVPDDVFDMLRSLPWDCLELEQACPQWRSQPVWPWQERLPNDLNDETWVSHSSRHQSWTQTPTALGFQGKLFEQNMFSDDEVMGIQGAHEPIVLSPNAGGHPCQHHQQGGFGSTRHQAQIPNLPDLEWGFGSLWSEDWRN